MPLLELPHTAGCAVCGPRNPRGLGLSLYVDPESGVVRVEFTPAPHHIGFEGIVHGGIVATVFDEAMVWAASWQGRRFCVCGEMSVRFRRSAIVGEAVTIEAKVESARSRLIATTAEARSFRGDLLATAAGKYVPMPPSEHQKFTATFVDTPQTRLAAEALLGDAP